MKISPNDIIDIHHMIVSVSYCDFVCLDGRWVEFIRQAKLTYPDIAKVYSSSQINILLNDLEETI